MDRKIAKVQADVESLRLRCAESDGATEQAKQHVIKGEAEPVRIEQALCESQQMLQLVLDTIPARVFWKDLESRYLGCNRAFAADAGVASAEDLIGRTDFDLVWASQAELYRSDDRAVIETGTPKLNYEEPQTSPSGEQIWLRTSKIPLLDTDGKIKGILGSYEEITDRKRAELALRMSEERLDMAVRGADLGTWDWNVQSGAVIVNERWAQMLGYELSELEPHSRVWEEFLHPEDRDWVLQLRGAHLDGSSPVYQCEYRLRTKSGEWKWILASGRVFSRDSSGRPLRAVGVHLDISERKKLEEQVRQAQKLESLGALAGGIAHDFNNLLTAILGHTELAMVNMPGDSLGRNNLSEVKTVARRAAELCRQLLAYSGKGHFALEPLYLRGVVEEMAHMLRLAISKQVKLVVDFAPDLPAINADASQLRQVILNLIINASEAVGDQSGVISLSTGAQWCDRAYLSKLWSDRQLAEGQYVFLEVADSGCGMKPETVTRMFEPFFSTKFTGRGLGLATVHGIVRAHGGAFDVFSEEGRGTRLKVMFPASVDPPAARPREAATEVNWTGNGIVLLIDHEPAVVRLGRRLFSNFGLDVLTACDDCEALRRFRGLKDEIACVILDMTMPNLGYESVLRELRRIQPDVKVIFSNGYTDREIDASLKKNGPAWFIQKPYTLEGVADTLRAVLDGA